MKYLLEGVSSERLWYRNIRIEDFDDWLVFFQDPRSHIHWNGDYGSPTVECRNWYKKQFYRYEYNLGGLNALIEKESGKLVGHCGLLVQSVDETKVLEIGYSILPQYWGKGYATESAKRCMDFAFENRFSDTLISIISHPNIPSQNVAIKNGMTISKSTIYCDNEVNIYEISRSEWNKKKQLSD